MTMIYNMPVLLGYIFHTLSLYIEIDCVKVGKKCDTSRRFADFEYSKEYTWQKCADRCYRNFFPNCNQCQCNHWDFSNSTNGVKYRCQLFDRCLLRDGPTYLSGDKNCHSVALSCTDANTSCKNILSNDLNQHFPIRNVQTSSWEDCGNHCKRENACNFWTFHQSQKCDLWKSCLNPDTSSKAKGYLKGDNKCPRSSK